MCDDYERLREYILAQGDRVADIQATLVALPATGPENGGQGEYARASILEKWLAEAGLRNIIHVDSPDSRVESGARPNIVARIPGRSARMLWLFAHMDVVPAGDYDCWHSDPWRLRRDGDIIYGRGVEDNQQAIAGMIILAEGLARCRIVPEYGLGLVFMSDEECGSSHGLQYVLEKRPDLFGKDDLYLVPDGGSRSGRFVEVAEKAQLWVKFTVTGSQCHASSPLSGINAFLAASRLVTALDGLHEVFPLRNELFKPPFSTFVPTRHEDNNVCTNIMPGRDVFYLDCRILPETAIDDVKKAIAGICRDVDERCHVKTGIEYVQFQQASSTPVQTPVMSALAAAIKAVYSEQAVPVGIGGATVAAMLRQRNLPAVVWARILNTCHQPDEKSSLTYTCCDAAVFAHILMNQHAHA